MRVAEGCKTETVSDFAAITIDDTAFYALGANS